MLPCGVTVSCSKLAYRRARGAVTNASKVQGKIMSNNIVLFNGANGQTMELATKTNKSGNVTTGYVSKKAYGEAHNVKGAALARAHLQYRIDLGIVANGNLTAKIARGELLVQKHVETKDGCKVTLVRAGVLGASPAVKPEEVAATLTVEQLMALVASKQSAAIQPMQVAA